MSPKWPVNFRSSPRTSMWLSVPFENEVVTFTLRPNLLPKSFGYGDFTRSGRCHKFFRLLLTLYWGNIYIPYNCFSLIQWWALWEVYLTSPTDLDLLNRQIISWGVALLLSNTFSCEKQKNENYVSVTIHGFQLRNLEECNTYIAAHPRIFVGATI